MVHRVGFIVAILLVGATLQDIFTYNWGDTIFDIVAMYILYSTYDWKE